MPASVDALGSVPMVDEMPVAGNGVASLGSTLSELPQPTRVPTSAVSLSPSSQVLGFQLHIELVYSRNWSQPGIISLNSSFALYIVSDGPR